VQVSKVQFEKWVAEAIDSVPKKFQEKINNLAFFVEDYPDEKQLKKVRLRKNDILFGLYEGYHQAKKLNIGLVFPDRITIFKKPMENFCQTEEDLKKQIFSTVRHEIAHHFGSDEKGARRASRKFNN
jgi:predicted Zn-dependent protease with MMP-like domain